MFTISVNIPMQTQRKAGMCTDTDTDTDRAQIIKPFLKFLLPIQVALDMSKGQVKVIYNVSCVAWLIFVSARDLVP